MHRYLRVHALAGLDFTSPHSPPTQATPKRGGTLTPTGIVDTKTRNLASPGAKHSL